MIYKEDWNDKRDGLTGWWHREVLDGWALGVTAPRTADRSDAPPPPSPTEDWRTYWTQADDVLARTERRHAQTWFGGVAFPYICADLGPGALGVYLGCEPVFAPNTVWYKPVFNDPAKVDLQWNPDNPWWQWTLETTRLFKQRCEGRQLVAIDMGTGLRSGQISHVSRRTAGGRGAFRASFRRRGNVHVDAPAIGDRGATVSG
jgi:hypothetical protein